MSPALRLAVLLPVLLAAAGCASIGVTLAGLGASSGMNHYTNNVTSRTFTEPLSNVRRAVLVALKRMGISVETTAENGSGTLITAKAGSRKIEIDLEPVTPNTTRMQSIARKEGGLFLDSATASEIIAQTEKVLGRPRSGTEPKRAVHLGSSAAAMRTSPIPVSTEDFGSGWSRPVLVAPSGFSAVTYTLATFSALR